MKDELIYKKENFKLVAKGSYLQKKCIAKFKDPWVDQIVWEPDDVALVNIHDITCHMAGNWF